MKERNGIRYLRHHEIDKEKWDRCIDSAANGLIYVRSFYLEHMARHWDALVLDEGPLPDNDYKAVMPLTWNRKFGIRYLYQPFLTAQMGIFGKELTKKIVGDFILAIPASFRLIEIPLNNQNIDGIPPGAAIQRSNYVLDLQKPYEKLYENFSENTRRNIRKASQSGCKVKKDFDAEKVIGLALTQMKIHGKQPAENAERFRKLYEELKRKGIASTYGITQDNELLASCIFFFSHNRAYYILVGNHPESRATGASHALIDAFIKDHAGQRMVLDFEGSDIPGLAAFYQGFGATYEPYPFLRINRLPFYLKWMK